MVAAETMKLPDRGALLLCGGRSQPAGGGAAAASAAPPTPIRSPPLGPKHKTRAADGFPRFKGCISPFFVDRAWHIVPNSLLSTHSQRSSQLFGPRIGVTSMENQDQDI
jgi:hypothetical protein